MDRSNVDHILVFSVRQILEESGNTNYELRQLFIDFQKLYLSIKIESLQNILIKFGVPKMQLN
jgi:hypothetical protein